MHVAGSMNPMQTVVPQFYYAIIEGNQAGPFSEQELSRLITEKKLLRKLTFGNQVCQSGKLLKNCLRF